jgi:uncharacterized protein with GYD domain
MPHFLMQFSYAPGAIKGLVRRPDVDHAGQAAAMVESVGASLRGYWYAFGGADGVVLLEAPDNSTAAAVAIAIGGTGEVTHFETTVLLTMDEARAAVRRAEAATHLPPGATEAR